jgi:flagellar biosynthesis protein FliQ
MEVNFTEIALFLILTILSAGMMVEHSRLAIVPFILAVIFGAKITMKWINEKEKKNKTKEEK